MKEGVENMYKLEENKDLLKFNAEGVNPADMFIDAKKACLKAVDEYVAKHGEPLYCCLLYTSDAADE